MKNSALVNFKLKDLEQAVERGSASVSFTSFTIKQLLQSSTATLKDVKRLQSLVFKSGNHRSTFVNNLLIQLYGNLPSISDANQVFETMRKRNIFSWTIMLAAFSQNGHLLQAKSLFQKFPQRDVVSWTTMISGFAQNGCAKEAIELFACMDVEGQHPDVVTFACGVEACQTQQELLKGKLMHEEVILSGAALNPLVGTSLLSMYGKCGELTEAKLLFDQMIQRSVISWTAMLAANGQNGDLKQAEAVFARMPQHDLVSFNAMLAAFARNGEAQRAAEFYEMMKIRKLKPDKVTLSTLLVACGDPVLVPDDQTGDSHLSSVLVDIYGRNGSLDSAREVFRTSICDDIVAWNAMITATAHSGHPEGAQEVLASLQLDGFVPDRVTFVSLLTVFSHSGMLFQGVQSFCSLQDDYETSAELDHFKCVIDLLGRVGQLKEALELIEFMPFHPDENSWKSLLSACKIHGDVGLAIDTASEVLLLNEELLSWIHVMFLSTP